MTEPQVVRFVLDVPAFIVWAWENRTSILTTLSGLLTPLIAVLAYGISRQQAVTAKQKLALDLFDRRLKVWESMSSAITTARQELEDHHIYGSVTVAGQTPVNMSPMRRAHDDAMFLFGVDVRSQSARIIGLIQKLAKHEMGVDDVGDFTGRRKRYRTFVAPLGNEVRALRLLVEPYMLMTEVGVDQPLRTRRRRFVGAQRRNNFEPLPKPTIGSITRNVWGRIRLEFNWLRHRWRERSVKVIPAESDTDKAG